jgi:hypothetical protein
VRFKIRNRRFGELKIEVLRRDRVSVSLIVPQKSISCMPQASKHTVARPRATG